MMVNVRVAPVTPEQGDGGGVSTMARTPPVARATAASAMMIISLVLNNHTEGSQPDADLRPRIPEETPLIEPSSIGSVRFGKNWDDIEEYY